MFKERIYLLCIVALVTFLPACSRDESGQNNPMDSEEDLVPGTPQLLDPGESIISGESFTLKWTPTEFADSYIIEEAINIKFTGSKLSYTAKDTSRTITKNPTYTTTFYYRLKAVNGSKKSREWSNIVDLTTVSKKTKLFGPDERINSGKSYSLSWTDTADSSYILEEADNNEFSDSVKYYCSSLSKSFIYDVEKEHTKYYRVKQITESNEAEWSDTFIVTIVNLFSVFIYPGSFKMGSEDGANNEEPVHTVTLSGFEMSRTEITQQLYKTVMGGNPSLYTWDSNLPVENVSWYEAVRFCNKLSEVEGYDVCYNETTWECDFSKNGFRLPTEAEWEYACRAGTTTKYWSGDNFNNLIKIGWFADNSGDSLNQNQTVHIVASKEPNGWGLYDMNGNVLEWCYDWYGDYYNESQSNPVGPEQGTKRVVRGGSFLSFAIDCRSSFRYSLFPENGGGAFGFRVVRR